jgi:peptidyl-dipeptidase Dcp
MTLAVSHVATANPLLEAWPGPYGGLPPFDQVRLEDFRPAFAVAMQERRDDIARIAANPDDPTFENTLVALEKAGERLNRVMAVYAVWTGNIPNDDVRALEREMSPLLTALSDELWQNAALFRRLELLRASAEYDVLNAEQRRLLEHYLTQFKLRGATLDGDAKRRAFELNQRLATLETQFEQNVVADESDLFLVVENASDLAGLPEALVADAADEAKQRNLPGKWVFTNSRSSIEPFLTFASNRALREKAFRMWTARGDNGNAADNNAIVVEILRLRQERSRLTGFPTYAHWRLSDTMAGTPDAAMALLLQVWKPAVARVREEVADMQRIADAEGTGIRIEPWDYRYYAEKVRKEKYDLDLAELAPYLTIENVRRAMFFVVGQLYGLSLRPIETPVFATGVTAYEVAKEGRVIGVWYFDPYARTGKRSGAWSSSFREQGRLDGKPTLPIAYDTENFSSSGAISWDDAVTLFHEFGHAMHTLNSNVTYPTLSGTNTAHDFVELPSHFMENYLLTDEALRFLVDPSGNPIPPALVERLKRSRTFNEGFATVEFLASAILDMRLHLMPEPPKDLRRFEAEALRELGMPAEIVMRHRIPHFLHLFSGEGYAAGYYAYYWAQVHEADALEAFLEAGGPFHPATAKRFYDRILSVGGSVPSAQAYRDFRGRDASVDAFLRRKGFPCGDALVD